MSARRSKMQLVRNIGIMAHIDAGKTTVSERLLYVTGKSYKMGEVHEGEAAMDFMVQERERGITITSAVTTFEWAGHELHLIDTPGHVDFTIEVHRSLRVLDGAVAVFDAVAGVEPQTETVWHQADRYHVPRLGFVNKMDRIGADFDRCLRMMEQRFGEHCAPAQLPIGSESDFRGVVDLIRRKALLWPDADDPRNIVEAEVPADMVDAVEIAREVLLERTALADEEFAERYLDDTAGLSFEEIDAAIRKATLANKLVPVLCGSALRNKGIQPLLDAIVAWLPAPSDVPEVSGIVPKTGETTTRPHDPKAPLCALAYKVAIMEDGRRMVFVRLYSGTMTAGQSLRNPALGVYEKVSRIFLMHANNRTRMDRVEAGNIFGVLGLKATRTGDTLCDPEHEILLESIEAYEPVISQAVEPLTLRDKDKLEETLRKLADEDPTFRWHEDEGTGQTIMRGMGELHLEILVDRLGREFGVEVKTGRPQVVYRETVSATGRAEGIFDRTADSGDALFGQVALTVKPRERGAGNSVDWHWPAEGAEVPAEFTPEVRKAIDTGIHQTLQSGVLEGYPTIDVEVSIRQVGFREGLNKPFAYTIATSTALRDALRDAHPLRLSPIGDCEISSPPEFVGEIIGSINQRRGRIEHMEERSPQVSVIKASVPIEQMFGYATELRSLTQGRASFTMRFSHYDKL
ncbi:MAG: elongation factor G [Deltaproteobacteria bacterium]|nr:elongation factor G [Deltaproteobacteria bacterium]MCB9786064.1 elongation factor G [Deltaproteobacteria bacterium]